MPETRTDGRTETREAPSSFRVLVIGYGNPSRQDDGVGHYVVNRLSRRWGLPVYGLLGEPRDDDDGEAVVGAASVRTLWVQQLDMGLAEDVAAADRVLFVDAHVEGSPVIAVDVSAQVHYGVTSHVLTPETLVDLAGLCYGHRPSARRYSVLGTRFDFGDDLSPKVREHADEVADAMEADIRTHADA